jgi:hypothetical protein
MRHRAGWLLLASLAALAPTTTAHGQQPTSEQRTAELKKQADDLFDAGRHAEAYGVYSQAYALTADPALLYNEGRALQAMGEYPDALGKLEEFAKAASPELKARVPGLDELIADVQARVSRLIVKCNVDGARVLVRERHVGNTHGTTEIAVRAGPATLEVIADGYEPFRKELDLPGKGSAIVEATLVERKDVAVLSVGAEPRGSIVFVDDKPFGPAPVDARLPPGVHAIAVRRGGYVDGNVGVTLASGEHRSIEVTLEKPPPITAKWWFWTGVGAVVAGGVVLSVALLTDKPAGTGTFSPGQVRGP